MIRTMLLVKAMCLLSFLSFSQGTQRQKALRDSTIKYGVEIEPYLKAINGKNKIIADFNYSPYINKFLKKHKYVKFPPYPITIGIDSSLKNNNRIHLAPNSGNRLYFPKGSLLKCPSTMKTNGYMVFADGKTSNLYLDGINIQGSKANEGYVTSEYGAGIALYAPSNVIIRSALIKQSSGDGITVRTNWGKQSENIVVSGMRIINSTRVGFLVTGIVNGRFDNIYIEETGEQIKSNIIKPQTAISFEPNDCTSKYVNCVFNNLETKNNYGPVLATANFSALYTDTKCAHNAVSIDINNWKDIIDSPLCYGATMDISTFKQKEIQHLYKSGKVSGEFRINNPTFVRNTNREAMNYYFFKGNEEPFDGGIKYKMTNLKLVNQGKTYNKASKVQNAKIEQVMKSTSKLLIK